MAEEKEKKSFPMLPIAHWWQLRKQFKKSIPGAVTDNYVATVLGMQPNSARANVLPFLEDLGIIGEDNKPTERATLWRDDEHYAEVCKAILKEVYPQDLLDAVPDPNSSRGAAERWFAHRTRAGEGAVKRMASLYAVLAEADASKQPDLEKKDAKERPARERPAKELPAPKPPAVPLPAPVPDPNAYLHERERDQSRRSAPGININLQVHISADATPDQIDQIFASMAKHIYPRD
jgi:hypothetical protein